MNKTPATVTSGFFSKVKNVVRYSPDATKHLIQSTKNNFIFIASYIFSLWAYELLFNRFLSHQDEKPDIVCTKMAISTSITIFFASWFVKELLSNFNHNVIIATFAAEANPMDTLVQNEAITSQMPPFNRKNYLQQLLSSQVDYVKWNAVLVPLGYTPVIGPCVTPLKWYADGQLVLRAHNDPTLHKDFPKVFAVGFLFYCMHQAICSILESLSGSSTAYFVNPLMLNLCYQYATLLVQIMDGVFQKDYDWQALANKLKNDASVAMAVGILGEHLLSLIEFLIEKLEHSTSFMLFIGLYRPYLQAIFENQVMGLSKNILFNIGYKLGFVGTATGLVKPAELNALNILFGAQFKTLCNKINALFESSSKFVEAEFDPSIITPIPEDFFDVPQNENPHKFFTCQGQEPKQLSLKEDDDNEFVMFNTESSQMAAPQLK